MAGDTEPTRQNFLRVGAWSVPVVALAVATPATAASMTSDWIFTNVQGVRFSYEILVAFWVERSDGSDIPDNTELTVLLDTGDSWSVTAGGPSTGFGITMESNPDHSDAPDAITGEGSTTFSILINGAIEYGPATINEP